jgi:hypothetical protein
MVTAAPAQLPQPGLAVTAGLDRRNRRAASGGRLGLSPGLIFGSIVVTVAAPPRQFRRHAGSAAIEDRLRAV